MKASTSRKLLLNAVFLTGAASGVLVAATGPASANVGVAAAVNVDARGRAPGGAPRVIALGNTVVFNEEITTDGNGLVQILLLDGTTFTVGPNSHLTIDEFVYNPDTGDAKVVASLTRGAFRFVGARTSQTEGGAVVKTPVGTIGIRGAVAAFVIDPETGEMTATKVAGKDLKITDNDGATRTVYKNGFTAVVTEDGTQTVRKATPAELKAFERMMSSKPGQTGGSGNSGQITEEAVAEAISPQGSGNPDSVNIDFQQRPDQGTTSPENEANQVTNGATQDNTNKAAEEAVEEQGPPPGPTTQAARVLTAPAVYGADFGADFPNPGPRGLVGSTADSDQVVAFAKANGRLVTNNGAYSLPDFSGTEGDGGLSAHAVTDGQSPFGAVSGTAYAGAGDFVAYMLGIGGDQTQPFYMLYGTTTPNAALVSMETGFDVREYTLTADPIQGIPLPFFNNDLYDSDFAAGTFNASNLLMIEPSGSETADIRGFLSSISIDGTGASQKSAAFLFTANGFRDGTGNLVLEGGRRGTFRHDAQDGASNMRGGIKTIPGGGGGHFFGPNANNFLIGTSINPPDSFVDTSLSDDFSGDGASDGYLGDANFATHHVGDLVAETNVSEFTRSSRQHSGFMAGMGESNFGGLANPYRLSSGGNGTNLVVNFNAVDNAFAAQATVYDADLDDEVVSNLLLTFGHWNGDSGSSAYIDDTYYGARYNNNPQNTRLRTDDAQDIAHSPDFTPGSYIISGRANPIPGYNLLATCETCDFIDWGWWGTRLQTPTDNPDENRFDYVHMGTWVAGDVSGKIDETLPLGQLPFGGSATYSGTAIATISRDTDMDIDGTLDATYIASGSFSMDYNFTARNGGFSMDLDGMEFFAGEGGINGIGGGGRTQELFGGGIEASAGNINGVLEGAFVNNGPNVAAGVIGNFSFGGYDYGGSNSNVAGTGTFAGAGAPHIP